MGLRPKHVYRARQVHSRAVEFLLGLKSEPAQTRPIAIPRFKTSRDVTEGKFSVGLKLPTSPNSQTLSNPYKTIRFLSQIEKPTHKTSSMAEHGGNEGGGEVVDQTEDRGGPMEIELVEKQSVEAVGIDSATTASGGDGIRSHEGEVADGEIPRAVERESRARVETGVAEPSSEPVDPGTAVEDLSVVGGGSGDVGVSGGNQGDDTGPIKSPPRDSAKGKGTVVEEEQASENPMRYPESDIAFRPPATAATSSRHEPITFDDVAEKAPDDVVARLLEEYPVLGEMVLRAKEERAQAIAAWEAAARADRERERAGQEGLAADFEAEERAEEEQSRPRVRPVDEAEAIKRPVFSAEAYIPPRPHLFVPSGFAGYKPPQIDYSDELVLRDPGVHVANTWTEVYLLKTPFCTSIRYLHACIVN
ncbi:hypothetical protein RHMOL_Rhmol04G0176700 [Rhododendron molle]|uniref:Uncharacterized protein n=1 Tax=Rhododendron molle TaxID=49168 RepID=A0ACC0P2U4_RHOML|nr:hypothetical protein RHMOL_Rhmol04G0176700 [Rhododendron molle]